jgi:Holliday junction resolvase RusA-like endonuclease
MDANKQSASWMEQVRSMAAAEYGLGRELLASPLCLYADFFFSRPQSHYGVKGIKKSAPLFHTQTPDIDKLARCLCDAITGVVWKDDRYVTMAVLNKHWTMAQERVEVSIYA